MNTYWFDTSVRYQVKQDTQSEQESVEKNQAVLCCAVCQHIITSGASAISVDGEHTHIKINPDGRKFLLRCFSTAPGCAMAGDPTSYFSWFAGYNWQFAHCNQCGAQMGWFYEGQSKFYGLIKEQLVRCDN